MIIKVETSKITFEYSGLVPVLYQAEEGCTMVLFPRALVRAGFQSLVEVYSIHEAPISHPQDPSVGESASFVLQ